MLEIQNMINNSTKDLKDIVVTEDYIISVGREELVYINDINNNLIGKFAPEAGNVNSVVFDGNILYVGCQNGTINIFSISDSGKSTLYGHNGNVCCLQLRKNILLSGSWDHTLKVWDLKKHVVVASLEHPGTVWCACFINEDRFITGCADKVLRIYNKNTLEYTMTLHNFCIRSVCLKNDFIYSVDNEGTLLKTSLTGALVSHNSFKDFTYCVTPYNDKILCCGENGKVYVLNENLHILDEISAPCVSCWKAVVHDNKIYVCGSDGTIYVFQDKKSDLEIRERYEKIKEERGDIREFSSNGEKFRVVDNVVYQWSENSWVQIGHETNSFDFSVNVELEGKYYKLSLNKKDNIYEVAENFLMVNKLDYSFKEQIVQYIRQILQQYNFRTYKTINVEGVHKTIGKLTNNRYIFPNIVEPNKEESKQLEIELLWLLNNGFKYVALDLYRFFVVHGFNFDLAFLMRFNCKDRKEAMAFTRLVTVLYSEPPFNLECLFPVVQNLRDIGYLNDEDLDDYYNNRLVRSQLETKNY